MSARRDYTHVRHILTLLLDDNNDQRCPSYGICSNIDVIAAELGLEVHRLGSAYVKELAPGWPLYSGSPVYPVNDPNTCHSPLEAYDNTHNMWVGLYGEQRKSLVAYMIGRIDEKLKVLGVIL